MPIARRAWLALLAGAAYGQTSAKRLLRFAEAAGVVAAFDQPLTASNWDAWVANLDREVRARLRRGDEDSAVNFLLYGMSFTRGPRGGDPATRIPDLAAALASPRRDERLDFIRAMIGTQNPRAWLTAQANRVAREQRAFAQEIAAIKAKATSASDEFAGRSSLYAARGLSLDTSLKPCFGIDMVLGGLLRNGLQPCKRIGVIGPGLDFTDKQDGYDLYPVQTIQPFAVLASAAARGVAAEVTAFDISPRSLAHLKALRGTAAKLHLPLDASVVWTKEFRRYWSGFGGGIGDPLPAAARDGLEVRGVQVRAAETAKIRGEDWNCVTQRLNAVPLFDVMIATNILVYYEPFQQALAMENIAALLRKGGMLITNTALPELDNGPLRSIDSISIAYSNREADGDHFVAYRKK